MIPYNTVGTYIYYYPFSRQIAKGLEIIVVKKKQRYLIILCYYTTILCPNTCMKLEILKFKSKWHFILTLKNRLSHIVVRLQEYLLALYILIDAN
jgi:uncharacterized protein YlbG (UPF0298 family)